MATLGSLSVSLEANIVRFTEAMDRASAIAEKNMRGIESSASRMARNVAGALAGAFTVGAIVKMGKDALEAADAMGTAAEKASMAVEQFSALAYAAKQSDVPMDALQTSVKKLSQSMVEASAGNEKMLGVFARLGVKVKDSAGQLRETHDVLLDVADAFARAKDGPGKVAAALDMMGKSGTDAIPILNKGAEAIRILEKEAQDLGKTFDAATTRAASQFNKDLDKLTNSSSTLARALTTDLIPSLNEIVKEMIRGKQEAGLYMAAVRGMAEFFAQLFGDGSAEDRLKKINSEIKNLRGSLNAWQDLKSPAMGVKERIDKEQAELAQLLKMRASLEKEVSEREIAAQNKRAIEGQINNRKSAIPVPDDIAKVADLAAAQKKLNEIYGEALGIDAQYFAQFDALTKLYQAGRLPLDEYRAAVERTLVAHTAWGKEMTKAQDAHVQAFEQYQKNFGAAMDMARSLEEETKWLGLSNTEREVATRMRALEHQGIVQGSADYEQLAVRIRAAVEAQQHIRDQISVWQELADRAADFGRALIQGPKAAIEYLRQSVKQLLAEMVAVFAKRWILQLGASMLGAGSVAGNALANTAGSVGQGTIAGSLAGGGGSLFGSGALTGAGDFVGTGVAGFVGDVALAAGATDAFAASLAAAVPVIGWIVAIGAILYSIFGKKGGAPKIEGSFLGSFGSGGQLSQNMTSTNPFNYATHGADDGMVKLGQAMASGFFNQLRSLGGSSRGIQFGVGVVRDPGGTAPTFVDSLLRDAGGREILSQHNANVGRSDDELQAEIALQGQRAILAGLQASTLPADIAAILNKVAAATASKEDVESIISLAQAYKTLGDVIGDLERSPVERLQHNLDTMGKRVSDAQEALSTALEGGDVSQILASEQELQQAIVSRYQFEMQAVAQLREAIRQTEEAAYQFALQIAARINAVGGTRDIAGIAMDRASVLRGRIGGSAPLSLQLQDLQGYVSAIDTWYQSRRAAIEAEIAAQEEAQKAIYQAQAAAAQARISALQAELAITQQFQGLVDRTSQMLDQMRLSAANPMSVFGRLGLATSDVEGLRASYESATGSAKATAASKLLDALQGRLGLLGDAFQRPSDDYIQGYNEIIAEITKVQADAITEAEKATQIQEQILEAQAQANYYQALMASATAASSGMLDSLNTEALQYYEYAEREGARLYELQRASFAEQLNAITGGMDVDLFIAKIDSEQLAELKGLRAEMREWATAGAGQVTVNINAPAGSNISTEDVIAALTPALPTIRRALTNA